MGNSLISRFLSGQYTVTRSKSGSYVKGRYVEGPKETILMKGSLQPISGAEVKMLEEGERVRDHFTFYSYEPLSIIGTKNLAQADRMTINDVKYRVVTVEAWQNSGGFGGVDLPHYKTILFREPQQ